MPSPDFERFLRQMNRQGRERADGVDAIVIHALVGDERAEAQRILMDKAKRGDSSAIVSLQQFWRKEVESDLISLLDHHQPPSSLHAEVCWALWKLTRESAYADRLAGNISIADDLSRSIIMNQLVRTTATKITLRALWQAVQADSDPSVRSSAARGLLVFGKRLGREDRLGVDQEIVTQIQSDDWADGVARLKAVLPSFVHPPPAP